METAVDAMLEQVENVQLIEALKVGEVEAAKAKHSRLDANSNKAKAERIITEGRILSSILAGSCRFDHDRQAFLGDCDNSIPFGIEILDSLMERGIVVGLRDSTRNVSCYEIQEEKSQSQTHELRNSVELKILQSIDQGKSTKSLFWSKLSRASKVTASEMDQILTNLCKSGQIEAYPKRPGSSVTKYRRTSS
jgi:hypothetical protein